MFDIELSELYRRWFARLGDSGAKSCIDTRLRRLRRGNPGDFRFVGEGVLELRDDYGPGYRIYYTRIGERLILLLAGGDKRTQARDIRSAIDLASAYRSKR
jgi:putative addiction module killer protein